MKKFMLFFFMLTLVPFLSAGSSDMISPTEKNEDGALAYEQVLRYGDYTVRVLQVGQVITITPQGFDADQVWEKDVESPYITISNAEIEDINGDNIPEVFVYTTSSLPDANGDVYAFTITRNRSMLPIYMPPIYDNVEAMTGYVGHDEFAAMENTLIRRFPKYDNNGNVVGTKQIQYKMVAGENGYLFKVDRISEY